MKKQQSDLHFVFQETAPLFLPYSVFLPPTPGGLLRRTYHHPYQKINAPLKFNILLHKLLPSLF